MLDYGHGAILSAGREDNKKRTSPVPVVPPPSAVPPLATSAQQSKLAEALIPSSHLQPARLGPPACAGLAESASKG